MSDERSTICVMNCQCGWSLKLRDGGDVVIAEVSAFGVKLSETTLDTTGIGEVTVREV
ncbi:hypothetical protein ACFYXF_34695 [Streptomyces sp. NPDC002680]|uniref:hypothetical protein n=1 Tax=Streptomyces sp. NPDC002680 TaxID=3364659 RepID=UPI0036C0572C